MRVAFLGVGLLSLSACAPRETAREVSTAAPAAALPEAAAPAPETGPAPAAAEPAGRLSVGVKDKDIREVLAILSGVAGVDILADPDIRETITIALKDVHWREALAAVARLADARVFQESERIIRLTRPPTITMEFEDADLRTVLLLIARQGGINIVLPSDVQGKVTLSLRGVPWRDALDVVARTAGYVVVVERSDASGATLRLMPAGRLGAELEIRTFPLSYLRPPDPYTAIISGIEAYASGPVRPAITGATRP